ncbi:mannose-P-dolichol utilization defect 1, partial [Tremellales sp. Uapishka_1]
MSAVHSAVSVCKVRSRTELTPRPLQITSITHNIPSFLRDPAVALIGEKCYTVLVYDFDATHVECLKYALSKGLGLGIVLGGGIVKIPQIIKIVSSKSARGLSLPAYILETLSYAISLAYASRNRFPFSTYGENFFLTIQNVIITLLIVFFSGPGGALPSGLGSVGGRKPLSRHGSNLGKVFGGLVVTGITGMVLWSDNLCPPGILSLLQTATIPLSLLSKAPQIVTNHTNKSTGNLSAFAVFNALLGCLARLFTTKQEINDPLIFWGFAGAGMLNAVLAIQMIMYWKADGDQSAYASRRKSEHEIEDIRGGGEEGTGRRWSRKLD